MAGFLFSAVFEGLPWPVSLIVRMLVCLTESVLVLASRKAPERGCPNRHRLWGHARMEGRTPSVRLMRRSDDRDLSKGAFINR